MCEINEVNHEQTFRFAFCSYNTNGSDEAAFFLFLFSTNMGITASSSTICRVSYMGW